MNKFHRLNSAAVYSTINEPRAFTLFSEVLPNV